MLTEFLSPNVDSPATDYRPPRATLNIIIWCVICLPAPYLSSTAYAGQTIEDVLRGVAQTADVEVASAKTETARAELDQTLSQKSPNITLDAQGEVVGDSDAGEPEYILRVEQTLFDWGRSDEAIVGRRSLVGASASGEREALLDAALRSVEAFFGIATANQKLAINHANRQSLLDLREMIERRVQSNVSPSVELDEVVMRLDLLDITDERLSSERRRQQLAMRRLTGLQVDRPTVSRCMDDRLPDEESLIKGVLAVSPTLERIRLEADAHSADARSLDASGLPTLVAGYRSDSDFNGADFEQRVYLALRYQFQSGGELRSKVAAERARYLEQQAILRKEIETITQTVSAWVSARSTSRSLVALYDRILNSKLRQKDSHLRRFLVGRSSWRDVLSAQQEIVDTQLSRVDSEMSACLAGASLDLMLGGIDVLGQ